MTQIDFYMLADNKSETSVAIICRLCQKIIRKQLEVYIQVKTVEEAKQLHNRLWSLQPTSFIPSTLIEEANDNILAPVTIGTQTAPDSFNQVLINLSGRILPVFSYFERLVELIPAEHHSRAEARNHYKYYNDRGYPIKVHKV